MITATSPSNEMQELRQNLALGVLGASTVVFIGGAALLGYSIQISKTTGIIASVALLILSFLCCLFAGHRVCKRDSYTIIKITSVDGREYGSMESAT